MSETAGAVFNVLRTHRFHLWRRWDDSKPSLLFIMLNPSTADERILDPTVTRCLGFAKRWGYGQLHVGNIFALRSTDPQELYRHNDPVGFGNEAWLIRLHKESAMTIVAWGAHGNYQDRGRLALRSLQEVKPVYCLGTTKDGQPRHPLYISSTEQPRLLEAIP